MSRARLIKLESRCEYGPKSVTVDLRLTFEGVLGPQARMQNFDRPYFSYPFFIAVTAPNGDIMAKEVFAASMTYQPGQDRQLYVENLRQIIPVPNQNKGARHKVMIGFQLSEEQLSYNRALVKQAKEAEKARLKAEHEAARQRKRQQNMLPPAQQENTGAPVDLTGGRPR